MAARVTTDPLSSAAIKRLVAKGDWDSLREALLLTRQARRSLLFDETTNSRNLAQEYEALIDCAHHALFEKIGCRDYGSFQPIQTGRSSFYSGVIQGPSGRKFIKVTDIASSEKERAFFRAVNTGRIPAAGKSYRYQIPERVLETPAAIRVFIFDAIDDFRATKFDIKKHKDNVKQLIWRLAEMVADVGTFPDEACPDFLEKSSSALHRVKKEKLRRVFPDLSAEEVRELHRELSSIMQRWEGTCRSLATTKWGFAHGDLTQQNFTIIEGKVVFTDMGSARFAPVGSDLCWLLYRNQEEAEKQWILAEFVQALKACGIVMREEEVSKNAFVFYCRKWLNPFKTGTTGSVENFRRALNIAADLVRDAGPGQETTSGV